MELSKAKHWWEQIDRIKPEDPPKTAPGVEKPKKDKKEKKRKRKHEHDVKKAKKEHKKHKCRRKHSTSSSGSDSDDPEVKRRRLDALRQERLKREAAEKHRANQLKAKLDK